MLDSTVSCHCNSCCRCLACSCSTLRSSSISSCSFAVLPLIHLRNCRHELSRPACSAISCGFFECTRNSAESREHKNSAGVSLSFVLWCQPFTRSCFSASVNSFVKLSLTARKPHSEHFGMLLIPCRGSLPDAHGGISHRWTPGRQRRGSAVHPDK